VPENDAEESGHGDPPHRMSLPSSSRSKTGVAQLAEGNVECGKQSECAAYWRLSLSSAPCSDSSNGLARWCEGDDTGEVGAGLNDSSAEMWAAFLASGPMGVAAAGASYTSWCFCGGGPIADELVELVLEGRKRATAGALWSYEHDGDAVPTPGEYSVITDGAGLARCVIRTTQVEVIPFSGVDETFAAAEGEGDLSLEHWRQGHWEYFTRELAGFGRVADPDMPVVCERFEVVYPLEASR